MQVRHLTPDEGVVLTDTSEIGFGVARQSGQVDLVNMTTQVNVQEAKTQLSRLLARAASGEDIVIARDGTPVARLIPVAAPPRREFGFVGVNIPDSFDDPLPVDELELWQ